MVLYWRILSYLKPHRGLFALGAVASVLFAFLDAFSLLLLIPFLDTLFSTGAEVASASDGWLDWAMAQTVGRFVDLEGDPQVAVRGVIAFMMVVFLLKNIMDFVRAFLVAHVEEGVTRDLRNTVYDHLLDLDLAFFGRTRTGQIISRLTHDVGLLRTLVTRELAKVVSSFLEFFVAFGMMLMISPRLTLAAFVVVPVTMGSGVPLIRRLRGRDREVLHLAGEVSSHIQETVSGIRLVKSSAAEHVERRRFGGLTEKYRRSVIRSVKLRAMAAPLTEMLAAVGTAILLWYGARLVLVEGVLTGPVFLGFIVLSTKLYAPVKYVSKLPALIQPALVGAERIFEFLDAPVDIRNEEGAVAFERLDKAIRFENVSLEYRPGEPVLKEVSIDVPVGSVVALVGRSGAGKTSVVDLLARFYDPTGGRVLFDGVDIRRFDVSSLRSRLGVVSQETVLFHDTIAANIAYGSPNATPEALRTAAHAAYASEFIDALPDGYETVVGERGTSLSGGQRQRLAIARAILRDPPILVFDEATSALDTESERLVQAAIERLLTGRTVFVIAHRLSTVQQADQIVVLDEGRVVEVGSHEDLLNAEGAYSRLHELQFSDLVRE